MQYASLVNSIAACFASSAQTFTRYNKPAEQQTENEQFTFDTRSCKMVVSNYNDTDISFKLRFMQVGESTTIPTIEMALRKFADEDSTLVQVGKTLKRDERFDFSEVKDALGIAKLDTKYAQVIRYLSSIIPAYSAKEGNAVLMAASNRFGNENVGLFVQLEDMIVVILLQE